MHFVDLATRFSTKGIRDVPTFRTFLFPSCSFLGSLTPPLNPSGGISYHDMKRQMVHLRIPSPMPWEQLPNNYHVPILPSRGRSQLAAVRRFTTHIIQWWCQSQDASPASSWMQCSFSRRYPLPLELAADAPLTIPTQLHWCNQHRMWRCAPGKSPSLSS